MHRTGTTAQTRKACFRRVTAAGGNLWSCGRSTRAGERRMLSTRTWRPRPSNTWKRRLSSERCKCCECCLNTTHSRAGMWCAVGGDDSPDSKILYVVIRASSRQVLSPGRAACLRRLVCKIFATHAMYDSADVFTSWWLGILHAKQVC